MAQVYPLLDREDRFQATDADFSGWFGLVASTMALGLAVSVLATVGLMVWLSRSVDNTPSLGGGIARRGPRWAIGAWFIPVVNIIMPALIVRDLARRVSRDGNGSGMLVLVWWVLYYLPYVIVFGALSVPIKGTDSLRVWFAWIIAAFAVYALGRIVTIVLVRRLQRDAEYWHEQRSDRVGVLDPRERVSNT